MISAKKIVRAYLDNMILPSDPLKPMWNRENLVFRKQPKWNYIDSCMMTALLMLHELTGESELLDYTVKFTNAYVNEEGSITALNYEDFNLDNINGGRNLMKLFDMTGDERYKKAFDGLYAGQLIRQPRLEIGNFWHKAIYPYQVWLDGAYMCVPFLTEYAQRTGNKAITDDLAEQLENIRSIMRDGNTGLYYHGYDEKRATVWADPETGLSGEFWLRSIGWFCAALADICTIAENGSRLYSLCGEILSDLLDALSGYTLSDGTLMQLPVKADIKGNYTETSGTLLYAYSAMRAGRLGISGTKTVSAGKKAFETVTEKYIAADGEIPVLSNICLVAGLGGAQKRDGSESYYLSESVTSNDAKGIAPYLMAYTEFISV